MKYTGIVFRNYTHKFETTGYSIAFEVEADSFAKAETVLEAMLYSTETLITITLDASVEPDKARTFLPLKTLSEKTA